MLNAGLPNIPETKIKSNLERPSYATGVCHFKSLLHEFLSVLSDMFSSFKKNCLKVLTSIQEVNAETMRKYFEIGVSCFGTSLEM